MGRCFRLRDSNPRASAGSYNPSLLIIAAILIFVIAASASIHLLLRLFSRFHSPFSPPIPNSNPNPNPQSSFGSTSTTDHDTKALIASLPISTARPTSLPAIAVCLSHLRPSGSAPHPPACRHAFHLSCVGARLRSSPSCPLCRSPITTSGLEIPTPPIPSPLPRSFSIGSEEEDIESVVARVRRDLENAMKEETPPPLESTGGRGGWLKDYVDRLASSASSSFSSMRRGSHRSGAGGEREGLDLEDGSIYTATLYRWLANGDGDGEKLKN
ncbi:E3 ubiquitin-protein ligase ATL4-like [Dioscorea cayenensis subsp. rotundata]|uniref:E3 ubiquitin-protein ligase ATL4-like n=1 Tax=Dioscorea cayennensis subsp. rotundata TaxID=55577 RepID=A0AB40BTY2_DIOCR|nr:E3 ubiquitin-protein ligase ATL4-like [Dioscorea cayenensis subsp. rotundata]